MQPHHLHLRVSTATLVPEETPEVPLLEKPPRGKMNVAAGAIRERVLLCTVASQSS